MTEADRKTERNIVVDRNKLLGIRNDPKGGTTESDNSISLNLKLGVKVGKKPPPG